MPHTYLVFVWHMHQPFYKDLATGEYQLPWTRMHALKDYYGMVQMLEEFPAVRQTFNLVPSMMVQIEEYAQGKALDPFLERALKPAEELTDSEREFILKYFFQANPSRMVYRYRRYGELYDAWRAAEGNVERLRRSLGAPGMRDLQVLSQLAWFDEIFQENDPEVRQLTEKGRDFTLDDQALMGRKQLEIVGHVLPAYRRMSLKGQVELSVTPYYHPILPLLCDSDIANQSHPGVMLPRRFQYPGDARLQVHKALDYAEEKLGLRPQGMWPSEGSVSDEVLALAADEGVRWMATDNGVLGATLSTLAGVRETYRPYVWKQGGREMRMIFRDHFLSDLIGFVYSRMDARTAAHHLLDRIRENARILHNEGRDAMVPVILDGENAWEHFDHNGRPFLKELYRLISEDPGLSAVTVSEALERVPATELPRIHPGSWINANYDVWIGFDEDNQAWEYLLDARQTYDQVVNGPEGATLSDESKALALEELLIAEGSDWCWWYGPQHHSENRPEFDKLFRDHLAHVYRALELTPPEHLSRTILRAAVPAYQQPPCALISPRIDGEITSYFEWMGSGIYSPDQRQGAMHGRDYAVREVRYGSDGHKLFVRVDLEQPKPGALAGTEVRVIVKSVRHETELHATLLADGAKGKVARSTRKRTVGAEVQCAYSQIFELSVDLLSVGGRSTEKIELQMSLWRDGLPLEAAPAQGWLELVPSEPSDWK
ncbi:glycoside hydrolase family 57 protein [uncultured Paludibaculum sp.]|uniref:glycoside hydrolase family 57 protein n=1 Tax=uncultured Paludibaculum sp. TaxID=1765020 RepID=UPI002AAB2D7B|nr:glycoside hydrolase family 57 protein [uncultured Paludibaculum sp.]